MTLLDFAKIRVSTRVSDIMKRFHMELCASREDGKHIEVVMASDFDQKDHHCYAAGFMALEDVLADDWKLGFVAKRWNFVRDASLCNEHNGALSPYIMRIRDKSSVVGVMSPKKTPLRCDVTFCSSDTSIMFYIAHYPNKDCKIPSTVTEYDIKINDNKISVQRYKHEDVPTTLVDFLGITKDSGWFYH